MTASANGRCMSLPAPNPRDNGSRPNKVHSVVMRMGRRRMQRRLANRDFQLHAARLHHVARKVQENDAVLHDQTHEQDQSHERRHVEGVFVINSSPTAPTKESWSCDQNDERLDEGLELQHHHGHHARRSQRENEQQRAEGFLLARVLTANLHPYAWRRRVGGEDFLHAFHNGAQRLPLAQVRGDVDLLLC